MFVRDYAAFANEKLVPRLREKLAESEEKGDLQAFLDFSLEIGSLERDPASAILWIDDLAKPGEIYPEEEIIEYFLEMPHPRRDAWAIADMYARISPEPESDGSVVYCVGEYSRYATENLRMLAILSREGDVYSYTVVETPCTMAAIAQVLGKENGKIEPTLRRAERSRIEEVVQENLDKAERGVLHIGDFAGSHSDYLDAVALGLLRDNLRTAKIPAEFLGRAAAKYQT
ncbi:MAG: hypothetical protein V1820_02725 [archaeon]